MSSKLSPETPGRWNVAGGIALVMMSFGLNAATQSTTNPPATPSIAHPASTAADSYWPSFRGPGAYGQAVHANPPLDWNVEEAKNILWKTVVPKLGMSSPVIWKDRLFLTGADSSSRQIYCFNTNTGELLWQHDANGIPGSPTEDELPEVLDAPGLAAPTATTNGRFVAAIFATGDLIGLNTEGKRVWAKNLGVPDNPYGHASSLLSQNNLLFVQYDQRENSRLLALDLASGNLVWQVERDAISWSSPILIDNQGRTELVLANSEAVDSYDPETGKLLWNSKCLSGEVGPSAAYADGVVFVANEYATASAIDIGNHGSEPKILWQWDEILPNAASPLANDDFLILPSSFGIVNCLDAKTGKVYWEHEFDNGFYSSPILVNDRVYIIDLSGTMQVFGMDDKFELLAVSKIGEQAYSTPAFVGDRIYIRGVTHLFCIGGP